jgi:hypothetical protein
MDQVYGSRDHGWLLVHDGLTTVGQCRHSRAREVIRVLTNGTTYRRSMVLGWGNGSGREEERLEPRWMRCIMGVLSLYLL